MFNKAVKHTQNCKFTNCKKLTQDASKTTLFITNSNGKLV